MSEKLKIKYILIIVSIVAVIGFVAGFLLRYPPIVGRWKVESPSVGGIQLPILWVHSSEPIPLL